jgi:acyl-coenzyme A thioesterase PaaI-like protein
MPLTLTEWLRKLQLGSAQRRLEWYPPFRSMRIKVLELEHEGRSTRILLPLNRRNRNPGGSMFGGCMASLADPIPALVCARIFPGYAVWTRALSLDFRHEARGDLELRFQLELEQEGQIGSELLEKGRASPRFEYGFYQTDGRLCALIKNTVAIRSFGENRRGDALRRPGK